MGGSTGMWRRRFQSTLSVRRATRFVHAEGRHKTFQSTLSVRRATSCIRPLTSTKHISIHALREESDWDYAGEILGWREISIHALREESDPDPVEPGPRGPISIHALREESDCTDGQHVSHCGTSILRTSSRVAGFEVKTRYSNHSTKK